MEANATKTKKPKGDSYSFLPCGEEAAQARAQQKAKQSILKFARRHLPEHPADADDPPEGVEARVRSVIMRNSFDEPTECLGFACPEKSDTCDVCQLNPKFNDDE